MRKKYLLLVGLMIFICFFSVSAVYIFTSNSTFSPMDPDPFRDVPIITGLKFIDGGNDNDTVVATTINPTREPLTVTIGYISQSNWIVNGTVYLSHEQKAELLGDRAIPINGTKNIYLSLPKGTLIAGKTYTVELNTTQQIPTLFKYLDSQNSFNCLSDPEAFTFYHMCHPDASGPVEEGIITGLAAGYYTSNYADHIEATIQNTGDFPITITGGFVNGEAAVNTTDSSIHITGIEQCVIGKNATGSVDLTFPPASLYNQTQNRTPFNVKLITAEGTIIGIPDTYYYAFDFPINGGIQQPEVINERAEITTVKFSNLGGNDDAVAVTIYNSGSNPLIISSSMLNGKATTILSNNSA
ncbi:MAG TPA: hypothetical protein VLU95_00360, partial [Candidatus Acidoferrum sp.]|nr:hypothetical protein [Candidatus Acidoferrum sp.]